MFLEAWAKFPVSMTAIRVKRTINRARLMIRMSICGILAISTKEPEEDGIRQRTKAMVIVSIARRVKAKNCKKCLWLKKPTQLLIQGPKLMTLEI